MDSGQFQEVVFLIPEMNQAFFFFSEGAGKQLSDFVKGNLQARAGFDGTEEFIGARNCGGRMARDILRSSRSVFLFCFGD